MPHKRIVSEMSKVDYPHKRMLFACDSLWKKPPHSRHFTRLAPLVSELAPRTANISPLALLGFSYSLDDEWTPKMVLELAGGITLVRRNAYEASSIMNELEREFEEDVLRIDFGKLEKTEKWYSVLHKAFVAPLRISAYAAAIGISLYPIIAPYFLADAGSNAKFELPVLPALIYSIAALSVSVALNNLLNPAVNELRKAIDEIREGIAELKSGLQGVLEETHFFRGR